MLKIDEKRKLFSYLHLENQTEKQILEKILIKINKETLNVNPGKFPTNK
jgi:alanine dehydrogenase